MPRPIDLDYTVDVYSDVAYHHRVKAGEEINVTYHQDDDAGKRQELARVGFGSLDEMEAVANAMLAVVRMARQQ